MRAFIGCYKFLQKYVDYFFSLLAISNNMPPPIVRRRLIIRYSIIGEYTLMALMRSSLDAIEKETANHKNSAKIMGRRELSSVIVLCERLLEARKKRLFCIYVPRVCELLYNWNFQR